MIIPDDLLRLWNEHSHALSAPIRTFEFPRTGHVFDDRGYQLGVINLSRESTYRESIAHTLDAALYRARRMTVEGAVMIDLGAESTGDHAELVGVDGQIETLLPVVRAVAAEGMLVSVETYHTDVAVASLEAGADVINLTGRIDDPVFYETIARHGAGLIMCYTPGATARSDDLLPPADEIVDRQLEFFRERLEMATDAGIERLWVDPGFGFALNLPDGPDRVRYQTDSVLQSFRLRELGWPVCVTLGGSVYLFREEVRCAETAMAVLCLFSKANLIRSHEVARVQPVLEMQEMCRV